MRSAEYGGEGNMNETGDDTTPIRSTGEADQLPDRSSETVPTGETVPSSGTSGSEAIRSELVGVPSQGSVPEQPQQPPSEVSERPQQQEG